MYSNMEDGPPEVKKEYSTSPRPSRKLHKKSLDISEVDVEDASDQSTENALVLYNPSSSTSSQNELAISENAENQASPIQNFVVPNPANRVLPSVGAFTVQCATCFKWRLIPTKEKYEEIRESILQEPFVCESAREWRPDITCDDPPDICQDGSRLWAIDKPNIAQPPPGWERLLRIRGEGSTKFADVYYAAPSGKRLRSMVEVQKYLLEHPEFIEQGVTLSQFSFQIPKPLQENYVRKRSYRAPQLCDDGSGLGFQRPLEPDEANPLSWAAPPTPGDLQLGVPGMPSAYLEPPVDDRPLKQPRPAKKKAAKPSPKQPKHRHSTSPMQRDIRLDGPESPAPPVESPIYDDPSRKQPQPPPRRLKKKVARPPSKQQMYSSSNSSVYDQDASNLDPEDRNATSYGL